MLRVVIVFLFAGPLADQEAEHDRAAAAGTSIVIEPAATPLRDALGRAVDPPVCCQLINSCSPGSDGASPAEVRSLCLSANGQPLTGQFCHKDGACRP